MGCEVIADKQKELEDSGESTHGMKVALVPASAQAALDLINSLKKQHRSTDDDE